MLTSSTRHRVRARRLWGLDLIPVVHADREAITEHEAKVKELRKQADDIVSLQSSLTAPRRLLAS